MSEEYMVEGSLIKPSYAGKICVGFWKSKENLNLPVPIPQKEKWKRQDRMWRALEFVEGRYARQKVFKGESTCRCCRKPNGNTEYVLGDWVWPGGLKHYLYHHNITLPKKFVGFILKEYQAAIDESKRY